jgi:hypothetical protein
MRGEIELDIGPKRKKYEEYILNTPCKIQFILGRGKYFSLKPLPYSRPLKNS